MKLLCSSCDNLYVLNDKFLYDIRYVAEEKGKTPLCSECGSPIQLNLIPRLFQGEEEKLLRGEELNAEVNSNLKKLYPMPHVTYKARKLINSANSSFKEVGNILKTDPALAARILKVANSAYYGMSGKISSIQHAATMLGADTLIQIITLVSNSKMLGQSMKGYGINSGDLWKHSITSAVCANLLSVKCSPEDEEDSFFAGLMHDSGKIILDGYVVEREQIFKRYIEVSKQPFNKAEHRILGFDHAHTGCELCLKWKLPTHLAEAIKYHHNPFVSGENKLAYILYVSDYMAKTDDNVEEENRASINRALEFLGFLPDDLEALSEEADNAVEALEEDTY